jgi:F0F1-type ATP synthase assembly protein I
MVLSIPKSVRAVLVWQMLTALAAALLASVIGGFHSTLSAFLGGSVSLASTFVFIKYAHAKSASEQPSALLLRAVKAELIRLLTMFAMLIIVVSLYRKIELLPFLGTFLIGAMLFLTGTFTRDSNVTPA